MAIYLSAHLSGEGRDLMTGKSSLPAETSLLRRAGHFLLRLIEWPIGFVLALISGVLQAVGLLIGIVVPVVLLALPVLLTAALIQGVTYLLQSQGWL